jgi:hypothetical protein
VGPPGPDHAGIRLRNADDPERIFREDDLRARGERGRFAGKVRLQLGGQRFHDFGFSTLDFRLSELRVLRVLCGEFDFTTKSTKATKEKTTDGSLLTADCSP